MTLGIVDFHITIKFQSFEEFKTLFGLILNKPAYNNLDVAKKEINVTRISRNMETEEKLCRVSWQVTNISILIFVCKNKIFTIRKRVIAIVFK